MIKKTICNNKGFVLPIVLVVFMVLMILGGTIINMSASDNLQSIHQSNKIKAYYLAKSGAETLSTFLIEKSLNEDYSTINEIINNISTTPSFPIDVSGGDIEVVVERFIENSSNKLRITAKGTYGRVSEIVSVTLLINTSSGNGGVPTIGEYALVALSGEDYPALELLSGAYLDGDILINTKEADKVKFRGGSEHIRNGALYLPIGANPHVVIDTDKGDNANFMPSEYNGFTIPFTINNDYNHNWAFWKDITTTPNGVMYKTQQLYPSPEYPMPTFPAFPSKESLPVPTNLNYLTPNDGINYTITDDGYYNSIIPSSSRTITIDMMMGNRSLRVKELNLLGGNIELKNVGATSKLHIYVDEKFVIGSSRTLNNNGFPDNVQIYYSGTSDVVIDGASRFAANIFVEKATINAGAGTYMRGNIISLGETINISGGAGSDNMVIYAPNALVSMSGSAQIKGSIISNAFKRDGGGNAGIIYKVSDFSIPADFFETTDSSISILYDSNPWR